MQPFTTRMTWAVSNVGSGMSSRSPPFMVLVCLSFFAIGPASLLAQPEKSKTSTYVKVHAVADKPNAAGRQMITVTLEIDENYFLIGNKVPEDLASVQLRVSFMTNGKPTEAEIVYPPGTLEKDKVLGDYTIYQGKVVTTAMIRRAAGDTSPIEVVVRMQGYPQRRSY